MNSPWHHPSLQTEGQVLLARRMKLKSFRSAEAGFTFQPKKQMNHEGLIGKATSVYVEALKGTKNRGSA